MSFFSRNHRRASDALSAISFQRTGIRPHSAPIVSRTSPLSDTIQVVSAYRMGRYLVAINSRPLKTPRNSRSFSSVVLDDAPTRCQHTGLFTCAVGQLRGPGREQVAKVRELCVNRSSNGSI